MKRIRLLIIVLLLGASGVILSADSLSCESALISAGSVDGQLVFLENLVRSQTGAAFESMDSLFLPQKARKQKELSRWLEKKDRQEWTPNQVVQLMKLSGVHSQSLWTGYHRLFQRGLANSEKAFLLRQLGRDLVEKGLLEGLENLGLLSDRGLSDHYRLSWLRLSRRVGFALSVVFDVTIWLTSQSPLLATAETWLPHFRHVQWRNLPSELAQRVLERGLQETLPEIQKHYGWKGRADYLYQLLAPLKRRVALITLTLVVALNTAAQFDWHPSDLMDILFHREELNAAVKENLNSFAKDLGVEFDQKQLDRELQGYRTIELRRTGSP